MSESAGIGHKVPERTVKSDDFKEVYTNNVRMGMSPVDVIIWFGRTTESREGETYIEETVGVRFSPQLFKRLVSQLTQALRVYETQFGEVQTPEPPSPDEVVAAMQAAMGSGRIKPNVSTRPSRRPRSRSPEK